MNEIIQEGKSREEALAAALEKLGVREDQVTVEEVEGQRDRFFGLLTSKTIKLKVRIKEEQSAQPAAQSAPEDDDGGDIEAAPRERPADPEPGTAEAAVRDFISGLLQHMGVDLDVWVSREDSDILVDLDGEDAGMLIGKFGQTLDSLQYLANVVLGRSNKDNLKVSVNVGDYRARREESLRRMARAMAGKVVKSRKEVVLAPMSPQDRRIVHMALSNYRNVSTSSEGVGQNRRVVISYKR